VALRIPFRILKINWSFEKLRIGVPGVKLALKASITIDFATWSLNPELWSVELRAPDRPMSGKRIVLHSFHSQVPDTIANCDLLFDLVICVDGHLDDFMGSAGQSQSIPDETVRLAAHRASAHAFIRRATGDFPPLLSKEDKPFLAPMYVALPIRSAMASAEELARKLRAAGTDALSEPTETPISSLAGFLKNTLGIELYLSPPHSLKKLLALLRDAEEPLIDIDVDYFHEFQGECYSPLAKAESGDLGFTTPVLRLIRKTQPKLITISEAKISAIRNAQSNVSIFLEALKRMGYSYEERLLQSDEQAEKAMATYAEYYRTVVVPTPISLEDPMERAHAIEEATKDYFSTRTKNTVKDRQ
jgi:hypothetical protein